MAQKVSPDKGNTVAWYRDNKVGSEWQRAVLDQLCDLVAAECPGVKSSIKWSQPVWESPEGPMMFARSASKHFSVGFWRGAEFDDPAGRLEGEGDRMKHVKIKGQGDFDLALIQGYVRQAVALNAAKGDPTKGK
jgi:hypothetical protein